MTPSKLTHLNKENALEKMRNMLKGEMQLVDQLIMDLIVSQAALIPQMSEHTISSGGKRIRPMLTLASARLCNFEGSAHIDLAACVEFFHTATLLHDDVVDKSSLRRGNPTANNIWGNKECILVGDFLLGKAFQLIKNARSLRIYEIISNASVVISEGEVLQLSKIADISTARPHYQKVISAKTAELFAAACEISGVLAQRPEEEITALREFGLNLGIAFQIVDDTLDYSSKQELLGKNIGDDFAEAKITLPVIIAYNKGNKAEKDFLNTIFIDKKDLIDSFRKTLQLIEKTNSLSLSMESAKEFTKKAENALNVFPHSETKQAMLDLLNFVVEREY